MGDKREAAAAVPEATAAPVFKELEEPVGYLKVAHILPFLKDGLKVRLFVAKIDVYVVDEGFFFVGIGILVPKVRAKMNLPPSPSTIPSPHVAPAVHSPSYI
eukprot:tig00021042_g17595.t1